MAGRGDEHTDTGKGIVRVAMNRRVLEQRKYVAGKLPVDRRA